MDQDYYEDAAQQGKKTMQLSSFAKTSSTSTSGESWKETNFCQEHELLSIGVSEHISRRSSRSSPAKKRRLLALLSAAAAGRIPGIMGTSV